MVPAAVLASHTLRAGDAASSMAPNTTSPLTGPLPVSRPQVHGSLTAAAQCADATVHVTGVPAYADVMTPPALVQVTPAASLARSSVTIAPVTGIPTIAATGVTGVTKASPYFLAPPTSLVAGVPEPRLNPPLNIARPLSPFRIAESLGLPPPPPLSQSGLLGLGWGLEGKYMEMWLQEMRSPK